MAVTLSLAYTERNDNKLLTLTDVSTDWGGANVAVSAITTLTLDIEITTSDNETIAYDQINLITFANPDLGGGSTQANLVWEFDPSDITDGGNPLGTADSTFPDGIYKFTYTLDATLGSEAILEEDVLMEGNVRNAVYEALRTIPTLYTCNECKSKEIMDAIFAYGYLNSIRAGGYVAKTEELISQLYVLERLLLYGSPYTW
jgi:hypothetical protein